MKEPARLGKYQIQGILGEGGMGIVYKGYDPHLARTVAIKTIRRNLLEGQSGDELRQRFRREARAEGSLIHSNIVTIHEYQEDNSGMPFFVMEYVEGKTLKESLLSGRRFTLEQSVHIIEQVLSALALSHRHGIVHRDIKPANIILLEDDTVKIADFGIAKMEESNFTKTGMILGTPQYLSPEQCMGVATDARSDLYSTAAVFYELLTGQKAFPGSSMTSILSRLQDDHVTTMNSDDPVIQRVFKSVIVKALAKNPDDRFSSAAAFSTALRAVLAQPDEPPVVTQSKRKWWWVAGGLGLVLLTVVVILSLLKPAIPPLRQAEQQRLDNHLKVARLHFAVGRLIVPEGSSAYDAYKMALAVEPGNKEARAGIEEIEQQVVAQVKSLLAAGNKAAAEAQLASAQRIFPNNRQLRDLEGELRNGH